MAVQQLLTEPEPEPECEPDPMILMVVGVIKAGDTQDKLVRAFFVCIP